METEKQKPAPKWGALGYEQVPGLTNRIISRYLRGQRRNMERFFTERGLYDSAERMRQIRLSRQGMMAKNRMFQEVLSVYATQTMQAQTPVQEPPKSMHDVRPPASESVAETAPGLREVSVHGVAAQESGTNETDTVQVSGLPDTDSPYVEEL